MVSQDLTTHMQNVKADELSHYGIKGMKWGVRRSRDQLARAGKSARDTLTSPDARTANAKKGRAKALGTDTLSNDELQKVVTRMNLEQQYSNLSKKPSPGRSAAVKFVSDIVKNTATTLLTDLIKSGASRAAGGRSGSNAGATTYSFTPPSPAVITQVRRALR